MSKIRPVTFTEFQALIAFAQKYHAYQNEPIPEINESHYEGIMSCLETPFQTFDRRFLYKGFFTKAAILFYLICKNHALSNGNKRMACLTLGYFCFINNWNLKIPPEDFYELAHEVTGSNPANKEKIVHIVEQAIKAMTQREE